MPFLEPLPASLLLDMEPIRTQGHLFNVRYTAARQVIMARFSCRIRINERLLIRREDDIGECECNRGC